MIDNLLFPDLDFYMLNTLDNLLFPDLDFYMLNTLRCTFIELKKTVASYFKKSILYFLK